MYKLTRFCVQRTLKKFFRQDNRFKGHSKWQNIRHLKADNDSARAAAFSQLLRRMKVAITEGGGSVKPSDNSKLSTVIDEARRKCMPIATVNGFLEKMEKCKIKSQIDLVDFRGPGNSIFLIKIISDNIKGTRMELNNVFKKNYCVSTEGKSKSAFDHYGFIITEVESDLDVATENAINVGAEEVELIEDDGKFYRFTCNPMMLTQVKTKLEKLNYKILTSDDEFVPRATITLSDANLQKVDTLCAKLKAREDVVTIAHNIELPEEEELSVNSKG